MDKFSVFRLSADDRSSNVKYLILILGIVSTVVIILISFLVYIVVGRPSQRSNKFAVLDNQGGNDDEGKIFIFYFVFQLEAGNLISSQLGSKEILAAI